MPPPLSRAFRQAPGGNLVLADARLVRDHAESLARAAAFGTESEREAARFATFAAAAELGAWSASIEPFYFARGRGEVSGFTVPAVNVRGLTFDTCTALFRAMHTTHTGAAVFELSRAEIGFTGQRPAEFATVVMAAALATGHQGPVFIQGDHFQANRKAFAADPDVETAALGTLIREAISAGFLNIDIDASTLVDLSQPTVPGQQRLNAELTARLAAVVRSAQPPGVSVSIGGEIGEVGEGNSTLAELEAYVIQVAERSGGSHGLAKVSVQTGTRHGGVTLADGTTAEAALDFGVLESLSRAARERFGMAGAVQHGASTLPSSLFGRFPETGTAEVHLATGFQDLVMDHPALSPDFRESLRQSALERSAAERLRGESDAQLVKRVRKHLWGARKRDFWDLPAAVRTAIGASLESRFRELFADLNVVGSDVLVKRHVPRVDVLPPAPALDPSIFTFASDSSIYGR